MCSYGVKILVIYALVLIITSVFSSKKTPLDPVTDVVDVQLDRTANCSPEFEGFLCWDEEDKCPKYVIGNDLGSHKKCENRLRQFRLREDEQDFTDCNPTEDNTGFRKAVNITNVVGSSISAVVVLLSMIIFICLESLHKTRISIHVNLFATLLLSNCCCIGLYCYVVSDPVNISRNEVWCRALNVISNYFMLSSYAWMLCETLHLHLALSVVLVRDNTPFRMFALLGWGVPAVITGLYTASRVYLEPTERCWIDKGNSTWILVVPILISLVASCAYLINIVRVLINKLHRAPNVYSAFATRKTARAALFLIPLFGVRFALIPVRPSPNTTAEKVYEIFLTLLASLQGLVLSAFLCFTNRDVVTVLRNGINRIRDAFEMEAAEEDEPNPADVMTGIEMV